LSSRTQRIEVITETSGGGAGQSAAVLTHLVPFRGTLQVDGYAGFGKLVEARQDASLRLACC
jgi:hypothetical protein